MFRGHTPNPLWYVAAFAFAAWGQGAYLNPQPPRLNPQPSWAPTGVGGSAAEGWQSAFPPRPLLMQRDLDAALPLEREAQLAKVTVISGAKCEPGINSKREQFISTRDSLHEKRWRRCQATPERWGKNVNGVFQAVVSNRYFQKTYTY